MDKKEILSKFSTDPERYYKVKLFDDDTIILEIDQNFKK